MNIKLSLNNNKYSFITTIKFYFLFFVIFIAFVEFTLMLVSIYLQKSSEYNIKQNGEEVFKILVLGESTSADFWGEKDKGPWPKQLEKLLLNKGYNVRVINTAAGGINTNFILSKLETNLNKYRPHLVVSMIGVNDRGYSYYQEDNGIIGFLNELAIVKIYRWGLGAFKYLLYPNVYFKNNYLLEESQSWILENFKMKGIFWLNEYIKKYDICAQTYVLQNLVIEMRKKDSEKIISKTFEDLYMKSFNNCTDNVLFQFHFLSYFKKYKDRCSRLAQPILRYGVNLTDDVLTLLISCFEDSSSKDLEKLLSLKNIKLSQYYGGVKKENYLKIYKMLNSKNINLIAMQYPTLDVEKIKEYFSDHKSAFKKITFVSNEDNFTKILSEKDYNKVFIDRFSGTWGHTTPFGHGLIVKNLFPIIKKMIDEKRIKGED